MKAYVAFQRPDSSDLIDGATFWCIQPYCSDLRCGVGQVREPWQGKLRRFDEASPVPAWLASLPAEFTRQLQCSEQRAYLLSECDDRTGHIKDNDYTTSLITMPLRQLFFTFSAAHAEYLSTVLAEVRRELHKLTEWVGDLQGKVYLRNIGPG